MPKTPLRAIVMAGGEGTRWGNHLGVPKHLVPVDGEPLLRRTVGQLLGRGAEVVVLGPADARYEVPGARLAQPRYVGGDTDKFASTLEWWALEGQTAVVYGDAYLSEACADELAAPGPLRFVGRAGPSATTGCPWGELFGVTAGVESHARLAVAITEVRRLLGRGRIPRGGGWEVYRQTQGADLSVHAIGDAFVEVDDWSDDFDYPEDYERWTERRAEACRRG
jgi:hypothetical protein